MKGSLGVRSLFLGAILRLERLNGLSAIQGQAKTLFEGKWCPYPIAANSAPGKSRNFGINQSPFYAAPPVAQFSIQITITISNLVAHCRAD